MQAMRLDGATPAERDPLRRVSEPDPDPGPGQLVIDVTACAVCRTDVQLVEGDLAPRRMPVVPGHQVVGRVASTGEGVTKWQVGDRAGAMWLGWACGRCRFCRTQRENLCVDARFHGWDLDGGYATRMVVDAAFALPLDVDLDDRSTAPLLCGGVIGYRSLRVAGIQPGGRLGLFGFGASARLAIQVAVHWGCEVHVRTRSAADRARAVELGATSAEAVDASTPPLDAAVTFAPSGDVVLAALRALDRGGIVAINAIHLDRIPEFSYDDLWWERGLRSVANVTRSDATEFLEIARAIPIRPPIRTFPLGDANEALRLHAAGDLEETAVLVP
jgi:propanol-preferring alcohol dehydrogenase